MEGALPKLKIKAPRDEMLYLRRVRDISLIEESDGVECHFEDVSNLQSFSVAFGSVARVHVRMPGLYPMKAPVLTLLPQPKKAELIGKTRSFHFNEEGRLSDEDLVGPGWRSMRGVHGLLKLMAVELLGIGAAVEQNWICSSTLNDAPNCGAEIVSVDSLTIAIVCDAFTSVASELVPTAVPLSVVSRMREFLLAHARDDEHLESVVASSFASAQFESTTIGASVCVAAVSTRSMRLVSAHLGNTLCHVLQPSNRRARQMGAPHDGFNETELARLPNTRVVKHGSTVRFFEDVSRVSRCLGLSDSPFVSAEPTVTVSPLSREDSIVVVASDMLCENLSPLEMSIIFCPLISAEVLFEKVFVFRLSFLRI